MKQIRIVLALLAVVFSVSSVFTPKVMANHRFANGWFSFVSGDPTVTSNYTAVPSNPVTCGGTKTICSINVKLGSDGRPDPTAFATLQSLSNNFTTAVNQPTGAGVVTLHK
jgi:hypothetical protein